ncbi:putative phosphatase protein [Chytriomyces cf. hyalinus JEL632]|nr:putative phosphatase protein [Chytriomyces cf. hyalinus JEL632]
MPENATTVSYSDAGINVGLSGDANPKFGLATNFVSSMGASGSTEPPKRFFKYARPFRWTKSVILAPHLVPVQSKTPPTDGGFPSGHSAEAVRNGLAIAYLVPQRFQEMVSRAAELGYSRIMSGYHSPLDVMGGARHATGVAAANILANIKANTSAPAFQQAQAQLLAAAGSPLMGFAHSANTSTDRFADNNANKALFKFRLTYGFDQIGAKGVPAVVPKGAEVLLETRLPYLTADQIRVVLKSTAVDSGYPLLDDSEGWGRLNLFDAADGYGRFDGDVIKLGSGALRLTGANTFTGGIHLSAGSLTAASKSAFGTGPVYADGGNLNLEVPVQVGALTMLKSSGLMIEMPTANDGLQVAGSVYLDGASLVVKLGYAPAAGDAIVLLSVPFPVQVHAGAAFSTSSQATATVSGASSGVTGTVSFISFTSSQATATVSGARNENGSSYQPAPLTNLYKSGASSLSMLSAVAALTVLFF